MKKEKAIKFANGLKNNYTIDFNDMDDFCDTVIKSLEIAEELEKAHIITGGRLNGRTYAYKCGLEDGKRKALEQQNSVLDKMESEVEEMDFDFGDEHDRTEIIKQMFLKLIGKYKVKGEGKT